VLQASDCGGHSPGTDPIDCDWSGVQEMRRGLRVSVTDVCHHPHHSLRAGTGAPWGRPESV